MDEVIYKTFYGTRIDLSKIVSISEAYIINNMGHGGFFVGFSMRFQGDEPTHYSRELYYEDYKINEDRKFSHGAHAFDLLMVDGTYQPWEKVRSSPLEHGSGQEDKILAVHRLQEQVDEIVKWWEELKRCNNGGYGPQMICENCGGADNWHGNPVRSSGDHVDVLSCGHCGSRMDVHYEVTKIIHYEPRKVIKR